MVHSVGRWTRGVQVKLWDSLRTRAIPERHRGVFTTRRYTNPRLPLPYLTFITEHSNYVALYWHRDQAVHAVWLFPLYNIHVRTVFLWMSGLAKWIYCIAACEQISVFTQALSQHSNPAVPPCCEDSWHLLSRLSLTHCRDGQNHRIKHSRDVFKSLKNIQHYRCERCRTLSITSVNVSHKHPRISLALHNYAVCKCFILCLE